MYLRRRFLNYWISPILELFLDIHSKLKFLWRTFSFAYHKNSHLKRENKNKILNLFKVAANIH